MKLLYGTLLLMVLAFLNCKNTDNQKVTSDVSDENIEKVELKERTAKEEPLRINQSPSLGEDFTIEYLMGKFDPAKHPDFTRVEAKYADNGERFLRKDAYEAFKLMHAAALKDSIELTIISATRNFESQKGIWEAKWTGARLVDDEDISKTIADPRKRALKILEYSSMPGSSRHHWGTDIDLNDLNDTHFLSGEGKKVYEWLRAHAHEYGYCQPYSPKGADRPDGYNEEKWHWSYMPVSKKLTLLAKEQLKDEMIQGFKGSETATSIGIVKKYVLGINQECL
ncbi:MAG: M15 family metallopeptidase [Saprospiraceae bacterium]|nr:M15 family metallopeptidase [Saprospiraceae bacterium]